MATVNGITDAHARIAVYDDLLSSPRIIDVAPAAVPDFIEEIAVVTYEKARAQGGELPYTVIREIAENFIHADFKECTVSIWNKGNTVRFSDQGPGIEKKELVLQPGISSATAAMKQYIRGVGSGFPIVREYLERVNGCLAVDDNAVDGVVVTLTLLSAEPSTPAGGQFAVRQGSFSDSQDLLQQKTWHERSRLAQGAHQAPQDSSLPFSQEFSGGLSTREEKALTLFYNEGLLGCGDLVEPLGISAPTATRLLQRLELLGLLEVSNNKKRVLSKKGFAYIHAQSR